MRWISGCLTKLLLLAIGGVVLTWAGIVALNPWALHIGGRSTPLLYWHGAGTVLSKNGKTFPLYLTFWPGPPQRSSGLRREGKTVSANLQGIGWLCIVSRTVERMDFSGSMYGGYVTDSDSLLTFRLLEWRRPFAIKLQKRGYFDLAGMWQGSDLVMDRPNQQGTSFNSGLFIDHASVTLRWASYGEFEATCNGVR